MKIQEIIIALSVTLNLGQSLIGQTTNPPSFLGTSFDTAGAIGLQWVSQSNLVYRIDYADKLVNSNTSWNTLYEYFPSQGTNTIWKDVGSEFAIPAIPHPNDTEKRFYRVVVTGTNTGVQPQLTILSPTNSSLLSDYITVSIGITSVMSVVSVRLFVDGQEAANQRYPNTNFILNTAQFANGPHRLFAVAETMEGGETTVEASTFTNNFTASPYNNVTFDNFITGFRASTTFIEPADAEIMTFKANFAGYSDWTLIISNISAVTVRTVSGTGYNMTLLWDGKDNSSNTVAANFYAATLAAVLSTNTPPSPAPSTNPPPSFNGAQSASATSAESDAAAWYPTDAAGAILGGWNYYFTPPPPLPPKMAEELGPQPWIPVPVVRITETSSAASASSFNSGDGGAVMAAAAAGGATTTLIPLRIVRGQGTFGIAYQGHHPRIGFGSNNRPSNGLTGRVTLNGNSGITGAFGPLRAPQRIGVGFYNTMHSAGYRLRYQAVDDNLVANDLRGSQYGGTNKFNSVNVGLLVGHQVWGSTLDFTIGGGTYQTYFPIYKSGVNSYDWVGFSQFKFNGTGTNGLRWMAILSCNNMIGSCYDDMYDKTVLPIGNNLHLLLGSSTTIYVVSNFGWEYASALSGLNGVARRSVAESWFYAGNQSQGFQTNSPRKAVSFRVAGWPACFSDDLQAYSSPDSGNPANITSDDRQVYP